MDLSELTKEICNRLNKKFNKKIIPREIQGENRYIGATKWWKSITPVFALKDFSVDKDGTSIILNSHRRKYDQPLKEIAKELKLGYSTHRDTIFEIYFSR